MQIFSFFALGMQIFLIFCIGNADFFYFLHWDGNANFECFYFLPRPPIQCPNWKNFPRKIAIRPTLPDLENIALKILKIAKHPPRFVLYDAKVLDKGVAASKFFFCNFMAWSSVRLKTTVVNQGITLLRAFKRGKVITKVKD